MKNRQITTRASNLKITEEYLKSKNARRIKSLPHPKEEPIYELGAESDGRKPSTQVTTIPLTTVEDVLSAGMFYQEDAVNWPGIRAAAGVDGNDCFRIQTDKNGFHKVNVLALMPTDLGQFSVWIKGFNGGHAHASDYEYVLSIHEISDDATPADEESMVIRWEPDDETLRLYPDITNYPTTYVSLDLDESIWQDESWHQITASWSYQTQEWELYWDDVAGELVTPATPDLIPWPKWNSSTMAELFTDCGFINHIYHDVNHAFFGLGPVSKAGLCTHYFHETFEGTSPEEFVSETWDDGPLSIGVIEWGPPRNVIITLIVTPATGTVTITGIDTKNSPLTETFIIDSNITSTYIGERAFARIDSGLISDSTGGGIITISTGYTLGICNYPLNKDTDLFCIRTEGISIDPTGLVHKDFGTVDLDAIIEDDVIIEVWYRSRTCGYAGSISSSDIIYADTDTISLSFDEDTDTLTADINTDSIDDTLIDWGVGANQVNTDDIPEGSTNKFDTNLTIVSANDSTPGVLNGKLVAGTGILLTEVNDGGDEELRIDNILPNTNKGHFFAQQAAAITASAYAYMGPTQYSATIGNLMIRSGSITGISASGRLTGTTPTCNVRVYKNGVYLTGAEVQITDLDGDVYATFAAGTYTFAAGDELQVYLVIAGTLATLTNLMVDVEYTES